MLVRVQPPQPKNKGVSMKQINRINYETWWGIGCFVLQSIFYLTWFSFYDNGFVACISFSVILSAGIVNTVYGIKAIAMEIC